MSQIPINYNYNPQATRRLVIARNLLKLDNILAKNAKTNSRLRLGLVYPQTHIEGIKQFLNSFTPHNEMEASVITRLSDYSTARIYTPDYSDPNDKKWKKSTINL